MTEAGALGRIRRRDVVWWTSTSFLGLGLFCFPRLIDESAGIGTVYSFALDAAAADLGSLLILAVMRRYPGKTAIDAAVETMGWFGRCFELVIGCLMIATLAESYRLFGDMLHETSLQFTPRWAIIGAAALCVAYGVWCGVTAVSRSLQLLLPAFVIVGTGVFALTFENIRLTYLIPHWTGLAAEAAGAYHGFYIFAGLQNLFIFMAWVDEVPIGFQVAEGVALNVGVILTGLFGIVGTLGVDTVPLIVWPGPFLAKAVDLRGFYIEHIGFVAILAIVGWIVLFLIVTTLTTCIGLAQILGLGPARFRWLTPVVVGLPVALALLIPNVVTAQRYAAVWISAFTFVVLIGKPLLLLAASWLRPPAGRRA